MGFQFVVMLTDSFMYDVTCVRDVGSLYVEYDLLHTGVHLLWL
jgi:hypothetical protein